MQFLSALWFALFLACLSTAETAPASAVQGLLKEGAGVNILALGERHGSTAEHAYLTELIRDPTFPSEFPVIVVEFGNALNQDLADKYVAGGEVSPQELKKIWQDTTVPMAWDSPLYAEFFKSVRDVNRDAPRDKQIRVLLGDPPVDWAKVNSVADFTPTWTGTRSMRALWKKIAGRSGVF